MTAKTKIEWTDHTFNIAWGCFKVSPGCTNCYADTFAKRTGHNVWGPPKTTARRVFGKKHWDEPLKWERAAAADPAGGVCPEIRGRLVFCSSMADVFEDHPTINAEREKLWPVIRETPHLTWQLLTKRPERIAANLPSDWGAGYPNVWLGTSIENADYAWRFDPLRDVPAATRFLSLEPLLGDVTPALETRFVTLAADDAWWVILGGESGPGARLLHTAWLRSTLALCWEYDVPAFVKQLGRNPFDEALLKLRDSKGGDPMEWPAELRVREFPGRRAS